MGNSDVSWFNVLSRLIFAFLLVFGTYNPDGYSYYHWGVVHIQSDMPAKVFLGLVLLIGWAVFFRAALVSFGAMGTFITVSFFGTFLWLVLDQKWLPAFGEKILIYAVLIVVIWILMTGLDMSFMRRKSARHDEHGARYNTTQTRQE